MSILLELVSTPLLALIFLFGLSQLSFLSTSLLIMGKYQSFEELKVSKKAFFFRKILSRFFSKNEWENLYLTISLTKHILNLLFLSFAFVFLLINYEGLEVFQLILSALSITLISIITDFLFRLFAFVLVKPFLALSSFLSSLYLTLFFPLTGPLLKVTRFFFHLSKLKKGSKDFPVKDKMKEIIHDFHLELESNDQKLLFSFITFRERVAKEIMVPRIDITAIDDTSTLEEASELFMKENYSRIPVFKESLDEITGVILYKDLFTRLQHHPKTEKIESLVKPVIYTPENKKISALLQEFRSKQLHLAIVVDEYGGTEGIVTIEDILEEIVGEIEDEYDTDEKEPFYKLPNGSWVVDAKMSIIDIESKLGIHLPHHAEYETIGGFIFHQAGTIPQKGWSMHHDDFDLEVISSNARTIEKVRITPKNVSL